jgi:hypothetical protein
LKIGFSVFVQQSDWSYLQVYTFVIGRIFYQNLCFYRDIWSIVPFANPPWIETTPQLETQLWQFPKHRFLQNNNQ